MANRGLLDTSVILDLSKINAEHLPEEIAISAITLAELNAGPAASTDLVEQARRRDLALRIESLVDCLPFDTNCARAYGLVYAAVVRAGRKPRRRIADLLIASTALAEGLILFTRNPEDFRGLEDILEVKAL